MKDLKKINDRITVGGQPTAPASHAGRQKLKREPVESGKRDALSVMGYRFVGYLGCVSALLPQPPGSRSFAV